MNTHGFLKRIDPKEFLYIDLGIFLVAFGIVVFRNPNQFASGGVSGLSLILSHYFKDMPIGAMMLVLNLIILGIGYLVLGKKAGHKSLYGTIALSVMVWVLESFIKLDKPLTNQKFLELIYSMFIPGVGSALVFNSGSTTGGTDIIGQIIKKYTGMRLSLALLVTDFGIASLSWFAFGPEAALFSIMGLGLRSFLLDAIMDSMHMYKMFEIVSSKDKQIKDFIMNELERSATVYIARGAYTHVEREVISTVVSRRQAVALRRFIKQIDPEAFITISSSTEIIGKGFGGFE